MSTLDRRCLVLVMTLAFCMVLVESSDDNDAFSHAIVSPDPRGALDEAREALAASQRENEALKLENAALRRQQSLGESQGVKGYGGKGGYGYGEQTKKATKKATASTKTTTKGSDPGELAR